MQREAKQKGDNAGMRRPASGSSTLKEGTVAKSQRPSSGSNMSWLSNNSSSIEIIFQILLRET